MISTSAPSVTTTLASLELANDGRKRKYTDSNFIPLMEDLTEKSVTTADVPSWLRFKVERAALLLEHKYYEAARAESEQALALFQRDASTVVSSLSDLARASLIRGKALLQPIVLELAGKGVEEKLVQDIVKEARAAFSLALMLDGANVETNEELDALRALESGMFNDIADGAPIADNQMPSAAQATTNRAEKHDHHVMQQDGDEQQSVSDCITNNGVNDLDFDVVIVGAGASGVGVGLALVAHFGVSRNRIILLERGKRVGESFRQWPKEMRFISPSFNQSGWTNSLDLNSIAHGTSPAACLQDEHPTGEQYANYVEAVANDVSLPIRFGVDVTDVRPVGTHGEPCFEICLKSSDCDLTGKHQTPVNANSSLPCLRCKFVIWAAGEFQYPRHIGIFPGSELCRHNSTVHSWAEIPGEDFIVIGGYESGIDAAVHLARSNRPVVVLASSPCWSESSRDPSGELAPFTRSRLKEVMAHPESTRPRLFGGVRAMQVQKEGARYVVNVVPRDEQQQHVEAEHASHSKVPSPSADLAPRVFSTSSPPILCIGFEGSVAAVVRPLFEWEDGVGPEAEADNTRNTESSTNCGASCYPRLTEVDESTRTEGLFLVGPVVRHEGLVFCFVYKFRQRFAVVAEAVASRLGKDTYMGVMTCRSADMFLDNFAGIHACCGDPAP